MDAIRDSLQEFAVYLRGNREAQAGLGLDSHYPDNLQVRGGFGCVVEECRLPHSWLPPQDQRAAHAPADAVKDLADHLLLCAAVDKPHADDHSPRSLRGGGVATVLQDVMLARARGLMSMAAGLW